MSDLVIPGLGQLNSQPDVPTTRLEQLKPAEEWRFQIPHSSPGIQVRLMWGSADRDGTELVVKRIYKFQPGTRSKIITWEGCMLQISGVAAAPGGGGGGGGLAAAAGGPIDCVDYVTHFHKPEDSAEVAFLNLHFQLDEQRDRAAKQAQNQGARHQQQHQQQQRQHQQQQARGPRILICGPRSTGKTTLARTLTALATRAGRQPMLASLDPREGMLALPGTVSAAAFGSIMDVEDPAGGTGVGGSPSSGPSPVPVKLPLVYYSGREAADEDPHHWRAVVSRLARAVDVRAAADPDVAAAGVVIDAPAIAGSAGPLAGTTGAADESEEGVSDDRMDLLAHAVAQFAVDTIVVLGGPGRVASDVLGRFARPSNGGGGGGGSGGGQIDVMVLQSSNGVADRDAGFMQSTQEAAIKEYFFGDAKRTLSPFTSSVGFDEVVVYKPVPADDAHTETDSGRMVLERTDISAEMTHWVLAVMNASPSDGPEAIRTAPVLGFIAVAGVNEDRRTVKILSPVSGRVGGRPMVWGAWPEPSYNLLG